MKVNNLSPRDQEIISWWGWGKRIYFPCPHPHQDHETISWSGGDFMKTQVNKIFENSNKNKSLKLNDLKWEDKILSPTPTTRQSPGLVVISLKPEFKKSLKILIIRNPWN